MYENGKSVPERLMMKGKKCKSNEMSFDGHTEKRVERERERMKNWMDEKDKGWCT